MNFSLTAFELASVPDLPGLRLLNDFDASISDENVTNYALQQRRARTGHNRMPPQLQQVVALGWVSLCNGEVRLDSALDAPEAELLNRFWADPACQAEQLLSWQPQRATLAARALQHQHSAPHAARCQALGSHYADGADIPALWEMARLCGLPAARDGGEEQRWQWFDAGQWAELRFAVEHDAVCSFVLALRHALLHAELAEADYHAALAALRSTLAARDDSRWQAWLACWPG